jgi:microcystin-dependent protein
MSEPFLAEIHIFGFNFAPRGYAKCDGQILPINQNQSLYSLLGTTYGGDGRTTFALPDLRSRAPIHKGTAGGDNRTLGQRSGQETVALNSTQMPAHTHAHAPPKASTDAATATTPAGNLPATVAPAFNVYGAASSPASGKGVVVSNAGGGQAHDNMQPYQTLNFCIALQGLFPSRN